MLKTNGDIHRCSRHPFPTDRLTDRVPRSAAAASYSLVDIVRLLLGRGANPNICDNDNDTPLHVCESPECADLLLKAGANLHAVNSQGRNVRQVFECRSQSFSSRFLAQAADSAVENEQPEMVAFFASLGLVPSMAPSEAEPELVLPDDPNYDPAIHGVIRIVGEQDDDEADDTSMDASSSA